VRAERGSTVGVLEGGHIIQLVGAASERASPEMQSQADNTDARRRRELGGMSESGGGTVQLTDCGPVLARGGLTWAGSVRGSIRGGVTR
jgi:hypothetical protein